MSVRRGAAVVTGSFALLAMTLTGCGTSENAAVSTPVTAAADTAADGALGSSTGGAQAAPSIALRAGNHGREDRVVLEFTGIKDIEVISKKLNHEPPVRGGSGEPIKGMVGDTFLHVVVGKVIPLNAKAPTSVVKYNLPIVKSAIVNDLEGGTMEMTAGLSGSVDYKVTVEGNKVIINMTK